MGLTATPCFSFMLLGSAHMVGGCLLQVQHTLRHKIAMTSCMLDCAGHRAAAWRLEILQRCCRPAFLAVAAAQPPGSKRASAIAAQEGARGAGGGGSAWRDHVAGCMLAALAAAMAELVRQVDVTCAERGAALALTWNLHTAACDELICESCDAATQSTPWLHYRFGYHGLDVL